MRFCQAEESKPREEERDFLDSFVMEDPAPPLSVEEYTIQRFPFLIKWYQRYLDFQSTLSAKDKLYLEMSANEMSFMPSFLHDLKDFNTASLHMTIHFPNEGNQQYTLDLAVETQWGRGDYHLHSEKGVPLQEGAKILSQVINMLRFPKWGRPVKLIAGILYFYPQTRDDGFEYEDEKISNMFFVNMSRGLNGQIILSSAPFLDLESIYPELWKVFVKTFRNSNFEVVNCFPSAPDASYPAALQAWDQKKQEFAMLKDGEDSLYSAVFSEGTDGVVLDTRMYCRIWLMLLYAVAVKSIRKEKDFEHPVLSPMVIADCLSIYCYKSDVEEEVKFLEVALYGVGMRMAKMKMSSVRRKLQF